MWSKCPNLRAKSECLITHKDMHITMFFNSKKGRHYLSHAQTSLSSYCSDSAAATFELHAHAFEAANNAKIRFNDQISPSLFAEIQYHERDCIGHFDWNECKLGDLLGSGEFSDVYELKSFCLDNLDKNPCAKLSGTASVAKFSAKELDQRRLMKNREKHGITKKARYALKHIKQKNDLETERGRLKFIQSVSDLAIEKELLSNLIHPHIIKLRGVATSGPTGFALILDSLVETLDQRIQTWRKPSKKLSRMSRMSKSVTKLASCSKKVQQSWAVPNATKNSMTLDHRLGIALQIASALEYLHSHGIVYRDLKPTNIGFDVRGDVKVFDLGLARFCPEEGDPNHDAFQMSSAGTARYMAPECLSNRAYNLKVDVYAFAIVLWEILSTQVPYVFARNKHQLVDFVVREKGRPDIDPLWPKTIQSLLLSCFDSEMGRRPSMGQVYYDIREVLDFLRGGGRKSLIDEWISRRRSVESIVSK